MNCYQYSPLTLLEILALVLDLKVENHLDQIMHKVPGINKNIQICIV